MDGSSKGKEETKTSAYPLRVGGMVAEDMEKDFQEEGRQIVNWIYKSLLPKIIAWLTGKDIDFDKVTDLVREAENTLTRGPEKAEWVKSQLSSLLNIAIPWILNFLVELAVAYCKKQGWIK